MQSTYELKIFEIYVNGKSKWEISCSWAILLPDFASLWSYMAG